MASEEGPLVLGLEVWQHMRDHNKEYGWLRTDPSPGHGIREPYGLQPPKSWKNPGLSPEGSGWSLEGLGTGE
jgi:hypothetical protein